MKRTERGIKNMIEEAFSVASEEDEDFTKPVFNDLQNSGYLTNDTGLEMRVGDQIFIITIQEK